MAQQSELATVLAGLTFPEGPRWHQGRLWFSDFYTHRVMALSPEGWAETMVHVPQQPSGLGWRPDGTLLVVSMLDRSLMRVAGTALEKVADLSGLASGPCNDMVVDAMGRAYVGNFGFDRHKGEAERPAVLVRVDPDGSVHAAAEGLMFPNGAVITPDGKRMIIGETVGKRLTRFDIGADGALSNRGVFAQFEDCFPDGICLDAEGGIWVADPRGNRVVRAMEGQGIVQTIALPQGRQAFACMLGGEDRRTLYVCTSSASGPGMAEKRDGRIETVRVDVPGAGLP
ncbi:MAG: SMP-30/gluconolactonase/LRE family protein [Acetobacteraceae bacterium]|nr:SMP-30/gluconolactonase/LRE family protein [Acetobacteraceae bacterium]